LGVKQKKESRFLVAGMWTLGLDVESEPPVLNEPFLRNVSMKFREKRKPFIISLKFRAHLIRAAQIMNVTTCSIESLPSQLSSN